MSKFADYYTHSPFAAMRTGCPAPNVLSAGGMTRCPAPNALSAGGMRRCPAPREGIRRGVGQDTRENSISLNQYKRNINEYP